MRHPVGGEENLGVAACVRSEPHLERLKAGRTDRKTSLGKRLLPPCPHSNVLPIDNLCSVSLHGVSYFGLCFSARRVVMRDSGCCSNHSYVPPRLPPCVKEQANL